MARRYLEAYERAQGFESLPMTARYTGGTCKLCGNRIFAGADLTRFRGKGWVHVPCTTRVLALEGSIKDAEREHTVPEVAAAYAKALPGFKAELAKLLR